MNWDGRASAGVQDELPLEQTTAVDGLDPAEMRLWESLLKRRAVSLDKLLTTAGLAVSEAFSGLQRLVNKRLVEETDTGEWKRR